MVVDVDLLVEGVGKVVDVGGLYIIFGLVDIYIYVYVMVGYFDIWVGDNSILFDGFSFCIGVMILVDMGSAGWCNFVDFRY